MSRNKTIRKALLEAKERLKAKGVGEYGLDAEIFMMKAVNMDKTGILINGSYELSDNEYKNFNSMVMLRQNGMPSQYILGKCEFMGHDFFVDKNVLIPRQDTEILVEEVIKIAKRINAKKILDLCTGSGAIAVSLAKYLPQTEITAIDISNDALKIAKKNAVSNNVENQITFISSDMFTNLNEEKFDIIVSNPPYIKTNVIKELDIQVKNEPYIALDGGEDGLDFYKKIINESYQYLKCNGYLCLEIGFDQKFDVIELIENAEKFEGTYSKKDLFDNDRIIITRMRG